MPPQSPSGTPADRVQCPVQSCGKLYQDLLGHLRKNHSTYAFSPHELSRHGFYSCECGHILAETRTKSSQAWHEKSVVHQAYLSRQHPPPFPGLVVPPPGPGPAAPLPPRDLSALHRQLFLLQGPHDHLDPHVIPLFAATADRLSQKYLDDPTHETLFDIMALPKVGLAPDQCPHRQRSLKVRLERYPNVAWPESAPRLQRPRDEETRIRRCEKQIENGRIGKAARILTEEATASAVTDDTIEELRRLHPSGPPKPFGPTEGPPCQMKIISADIHKVVKGYPSETSPGISGWSVGLIKLLLSRDGETPFVKFLVTLTNQIAQGTAPGRDFLVAGILNAFDKASGGIRPLVIPEIFYNLASKVLLPKGFVEGSLLPCQFGVGVKGGVEPILRVTQKAVNGELPQTYVQHVSVDSRNAFNEVDRKYMAEEIRTGAPSLYRVAKWSYDDPVLLFTLGPDGLVVVINSTQGGCQGHTLFPYFFSLSFKPVLQDLIRELGPIVLPAAYLDDAPHLLAEPVAERVIEIHSRHEHRGFYVNRDKTKITDLTPTTELKLLGSYIGARPAHFLREKINEEVLKLPKLNKLSAQHALLLLRLSFQQRLRHLTRTLPPTPEVLELFNNWDDELLQSLYRLRGKRTDVQPRDKEIAQLPMKMGGLGFLSHRDSAPHAKAASEELSDFVLRPLLGIEDDGKTLDDLSSQRKRFFPVLANKQAVLHAQLPTSMRTAMVDNESPLSAKWPSAIPFDQRSSLSGIEIAVGLSHRSLVPGHLAVCKHCHRRANLLGHDETCTQRYVHRVVRHESIKKTLDYHLRTIPNTQVQMEPPVRVGDRPTRNQLRADLRVTGPASYKQATTDYDLSIVSTFAAAFQQPRGSVTADEIIESNLAKREAEKIAKYAHLTPNGFHPIVMTSSGTLSRATFRIFKFWKKKMGPPTFSSLLMNISFGLLRMRARNYCL